MKQLINRYKDLLKKGYFFEAHEALEEYWFPRRKDKSPKVLIVKGFINAAVSLELHKRGRLQASKRVWKTYEKLTKLLNENSDSSLKELKSYVDSFKIDN